MNSEELKRNLRLRDRAAKVLSKDGHFRVVCVKNSNVALNAQLQHNYDSISAMWLSRLLSGASLAASLLKGEERVALEIEGNGKISRLFAEAMQIGEVRGYAIKKDANAEFNIDTLDELLGIGLLKMTKVLYNRAEPVQGIVPLQAGDISTDLTYYYHQSEQIPSAVILDSNIDDDGNILHSGGLLLQVMPGYSDSELLNIYESIKSKSKLTDYLAKDYTVLQYLEEVLPFEFDILSNTPVDFYCRCSKENFMSKLMTLGKQEITDMRNSGQNELVCRYCNKHYYLSDEDFETLSTELTAQSN